MLGEGKTSYSGGTKTSTVVYGRLPFDKCCCIQAESIIPDLTKTTKPKRIEQDQKEPGLISTDQIEPHEIWLDQTRPGQLHSIHVNSSSAS